MSFRSKIIKTCEVIKSHGEKSLSKLAELTNETKSSVYRQIKKAMGRSKISGSDFFETAEGEQWLRRLVLAVTLVFGLQAKVGADRLALFFELICVTQFVGVSASSMGRLKKTMMQKLQDYKAALQPKLDKLSASLSVVLGADETFFDRLLILLLMDLSSGFIFLEEDSPNRKASTWNSKTALVRHKFKEILCLTSDRAKSLIKFSKEAKVKSIADLYHLQQSVVRLFKFAFAAKRRSLKKQKRAAEKELKKLIASKSQSELIIKQEQVLKEIEERNTIVNKGQTVYRQQLKEISTATHPFGQHSHIKTSAELSEQLSSSLAILRNVAKDCDIKDNKKHLSYFENNIKDMSTLVDLWWQWIGCDLENHAIDDELKVWLKIKLLPMLYWEQQIKKSRGSKPLKEHYIDLHNKAESNLSASLLTKQYLTAQWKEWAKEWVLKFQRSTSQVEGRNARLSENNICLRGMEELHIKTDTFLHNFWITRDDGTTAVERLFKFKPPNIFEWLCENMPELAQPRKRWKKSKNILPQLDVAAAT